MALALLAFESDCSCSEKTRVPSSETENERSDSGSGTGVQDRDSRAGDQGDSGSRNAEAGAVDARVDGGGNATSDGGVGQGDASVGLGEPEALYRLSEDDAPRFTLAVDGEHLYWFRKNTDLMRAGKNGNGEPEVLVERTGSVRNLVGDRTHLFWTSAGNVVKYAKDSGDTDVFPLDRLYDVLNMSADEDSLYLVEPGCASIIRVNKQTGQIDTVRLAREGSNGGAFPISVGEDHVYCGGGEGGSTIGGIYRLEKDGAAIEKVTAVPDPDGDGICDPNVEDIAEIGDSLYFLHRYRCPQEEVYRLAMVPRNGGSLRDLEVVNGRGEPGGMLYDQARKTLYWITINDNGIGSYAVDTGALDVAHWRDDHPMYSRVLRSDEQYLYWVDFYGIYRQKKLPSQPPGHALAGHPSRQGEKIRREARVTQAFTRADVAFASHYWLGFLDRPHFVAQSRSLHTRCLRFVSTLASSYARLASG